MVISTLSLLAVSPDSALRIMTGAVSSILKVLDSHWLVFQAISLISTVHLASIPSSI